MMIITHDSFCCVWGMGHWPWRKKYGIHKNRANASMLTSSHPWNHWNYPFVKNRRSLASMTGKRKKPNLIWHLFCLPRWEFRCNHSFSLHHMALESIWFSSLEYPCVLTVFLLINFFFLWCFVRTPVLLWDWWWWCAKRRECAIATVNHRGFLKLVACWRLCQRIKVAGARLPFWHVWCTMMQLFDLQHTLAHLLHTKYST